MVMVLILEVLCWHVHLSMFVVIGCDHLRSWVIHEVHNLVITVLKDLSLVTCCIKVATIATTMLAAWHFDELTTGTAPVRQYLSCCVRRSDQTYILLCYQIREIGLHHISSFGLSALGALLLFDYKLFLAHSLLEQWSTRHDTHVAVLLLGFLLRGRSWGI